MHKIIIIGLVFGFNLVLLGIANAQTPAAITVRPTLADIYQLAISAVQQKIIPVAGSQVNIEPHPLSDRINVPLCRGEVQAEVASDRAIGRNNTVKVSCDSPELDYPWQIFMAVKVEVNFPVVIAKRPINVGELLTADMLDIALIEQTQLRGEQSSEIESLLGSRSKRRLGQGSPVFIDNLCFVCEGDSVTIIAKSQNFTIRTHGYAQSDGIPGEHIRIKNANSHKMLSAVVTGVGTVEIRM
ncbi:flagellar basal body P-ring formation chaperone FlgA [Shewanella sp. NIFS-20-20]|uniref:flagellar basal body P-ring formation chaperone FlgA n=1 Tax=Shewanella sp. NIFS-20-20 TaxID=2853806 RepID=UPI001C472BA2|nr:flagellar basal body P-ring formation chaperone FlgA [Shewanella sp. NIFS-20-20]MBV7314768.1 flagellar basal body P-ring formation protein FlgA [Shewanella sp. NIFS-20-20]